MRINSEVRKQLKFKNLPAGEVFREKTKYQTSDTPIYLKLMPQIDSAHNAVNLKTDCLVFLGSELPVCKVECQMVFFIED